MGWRSSLDITATDARAALIAKILEADAGLLERMLSAAFNDSSHSFCVVHKYAVDADGQRHPDQYNGGPL